MSVDNFFLSASATDLNYPEIRPSLDLNFARTKTLDPRITFTRSSGGSYVGADGLIKYAGVNEARFDHDPVTGESLGLLIEEQRTNSIRNNTMVGAVAGTPGTTPTYWGVTNTANGLSRQIVETGVAGGITYIRIRISGTTTASFTFFNIGYDLIAASAGQTWTASAYYRLHGGSLTGVTLQHEVARFGPGYLYLGSNVLPFVPGSGPLGGQRYVYTTTVSDAGLTYIGYGLQCVVVTSGTVVDFTVDISLPQLEQGAFATSVIPTTTAARTRQPDVARITGTNFSSWYRQDEGTVFADATTNARHGGSNSFPRIMSVSDGTNNNQMEPYYRVLSGYTDAGYRIANAGAIQAQFDTNDNRNGQKIAFGYASNNFPLVIGGTVVANDTSGTVPTVSSLGLGVRGDGGTFLNGTIRRLTYWPKRLPNSQLRALTR